MQHDQEALYSSQTTLKELGLNRITKTDIAVRAYSSDEQLLVLLEALRTLASSMSASRKAARGLLSGRAANDASIGFADPANDVAEDPVQNTGLREERVLVDDHCTVLRFVRGDVAGDRRQCGRERRRYLPLD